MNQKHLLTLLVMAAMASASLFGCLQAFRYNCSMADSLLSTDTEALANFESFWNWLFQRTRWDREKYPCSSTNSGSTSGAVNVEGGGVSVGASGSSSSSNSYQGYLLLCAGSENGTMTDCYMVDCTGKVTKAR